MWARCCGLLAVVGCYAPHAATGVPCSPIDNLCPGDQQCMLVDGQHICVEGRPPGDTSLPPRDGAVPPTDGRDGSSPVQGWTLVQTKDSVNMPTVSLAATGTGHLIIVAVQLPIFGPIMSVSDDAGNTYQFATGTRSRVLTDNLQVEIWYAL